MFDAKARAHRDQHDLIMQAAWTTAALGRVKKMPPMKNFMISTTAKPKRQSWQAMYAAAALWAADRGSIEGGAA